MNWQGANKGLSVQLQPPPHNQSEKGVGNWRRRKQRSEDKMTDDTDTDLSTFQRELFGCVDEDVSRFPYSPLRDAWTGGTNGIWASW